MLIRKSVHFGLNAIGVALWLPAMLLMWATTHLAVIGARVWSDADRGNCWSFALPRWYEQGGYLAISLRRLRWRALELRIPHAIWLPGGLPDGFRQTTPVYRARGLLDAWLGLKTLYFRFIVVGFELPSWRWPGAAAAGPGAIRSGLRALASRRVISAVVRILALAACAAVVCAAAASLFVGMAGPLEDPAAWVRVFTTLPGGR